MITQLWEHYQIPYLPYIHAQRPLPKTKLTPSSLLRFQLHRLSFWIAFLGRFRMGCGHPSSQTSVVPFSLYTCLTLFDLLFNSSQAGTFRSVYSSEFYLPPTHPRDSQQFNSLLPQRTESYSWGAKISNLTLFMCKKHRYTYNV